MAVASCPTANLVGCCTISPIEEFAYAPATPADVSGLLRTALRAEDPVIFLMHKRLSGLKGDGPPDGHMVPFGSARVVREGTHVTVVSYTYTVGTISEAAQQLGEEGISAEVVDLRILWPLGTATIIDSVRKTGRLVIVHEDTLTGGWGAEVAARAADECIYSLEAPIKRVATYDTPLPFAPAMEPADVPTVERLASNVRELCLSLLLI